MADKYAKVKLAAWKFVENCLSVKVWVIFVFMFLSAALLWKVGLDKDTFATWCTGNGSIVATVLAIREGIKVRKITAASNGATEEQRKDIEKIMT
jgi:uncharacterized membrane protein